MSPRKRFSQLLAALFLCLALGVFALWLHEQHETRQIMRQAGTEHARIIDRVLVLTGRSLAQFAHDYSLWTETVDFVEADQPDLNWAEINLHSSLATFDATAVWVFRADGSLFHGTANAPVAQVPPAALTPDQVRALFAAGPATHFHLPVGDNVLEVRGAVIVPSADIQRVSPPRGFLLVARLWDRPHLAELAKVTGCQIDLADEPHTPPPTLFEHGIHFDRPLRDWQGRTIKQVCVTYLSPELTHLAESDAWEALIFLGYGSLAIGCVVYFAERWVLGPIIRIGESLTTGSLEPIRGLYEVKSEMGRVARMVRSSFQDREALRVTLEDRARLGRDLHDGVIQTLYAGGMNLASIRAILRTDPGAAESLLDQTRAELNATIRDVRNFISKLEPEHAAIRLFSEAVRNLTEFMQAVRPARFTQHIDDEFATSLPIGLRTQLLHVVREAVSNALRHGGADAIAISLQTRSDGGGELVVTDNGSGFDPDHALPTGHGLDNMAGRARELAGPLDIQSQIGKGTRIVLTFPPAASS
jgi:signal transduction histidine kinase